MRLGRVALAAVHAEAAEVHVPEAVLRVRVALLGGAAEERERRSLFASTPTPFACMCPRCDMASASPAAAACAKYRYAARWSRATPLAPVCNNAPTALAASALPMSALYR